MRVELDHLFICTDAGAPEGDDLVRAGLVEGPPNQHPGQGTANRRFAFKNAMIELLWVCDPQEAQNEGTRRTLLWDRWGKRSGPASPFGICLRPAGDENVKAPFEAWEYRPAYLAAPLSMHLAEAPIEEPMWVYLDFLRGADRESHFTEHPLGVREITGLNLTSPTELRSNAAQVALSNGVLRHRVGSESLLEIEFDGNRRKRDVDFRPRLPLIFKI